MFQIIEQVVGNAVVSSGISYEALCAILIGSLFAIMIIGLVVGQELAFVLGGTGLIIGVLACGRAFSLHTLSVGPPEGRPWLSGYRSFHHLRRYDRHCRCIRRYNGDALHAYPAQMRV